MIAPTAMMMLKRTNTPVIACLLRTQGRELRLSARFPRRPRPTRLKKAAGAGTVRTPERQVPGSQRRETPALIRRVARPPIVSSSCGHMTMRQLCRANRRAKSRDACQEYAVSAYGASRRFVIPSQCAPHVDANSGNGTFRLSTDFPGIGAGTNSRVRAPSNSGESNWQRDLPPDRMAGIMPASGGWFPSASRGARAADQQLAPSTYIHLYEVRRHKHVRMRRRRA